MGFLAFLGSCGVTGGRLVTLQEMDQLRRAVTLLRNRGRPVWLGRHIFWEYDVRAKTPAIYEGRGWRRKMLWNAHMYEHQVTDSDVRWAIALTFGFMATPSWLVKPEDYVDY